MIDEHPSVFMARPKEVHFFDGSHVDDIEWYSNHFSDAADVQKAGEATPWYLHDPAAVRAMADTVPDVRIVVILRDPVDRTYSHYWMERIRGRAGESFEEFLDSTDILGVSRYVDHLTYLTEHFPRDQVLVLLHDDLKQKSALLYTELCDFLDIDSGYVPSASGTIVNQYVEFRSLTLRSWAKALPPSLAVVRRVLDRLNTRRSVSYPPMRPETKERLANYYEGPNTELASWLGQELPDWTQPSADS